MKIELDAANIPTSRKVSRLLEISIGVGVAKYPDELSLVTLDNSTLARQILTMYRSWSGHIIQMSFPWLHWITQPSRGKYIHGRRPRTKRSNVPGSIIFVAGKVKGVRLAHIIQVVKRRLFRSFKSMTSSFTTT
jgi:hypothetical protein